MNHYKIALVGNPNVGKTSLFNKITKLRQKVGNYPGITVEKREGTIERNGNKFSIIDLPGTYSIYPSSLDEEIVFKILGDPSNELYPDLTAVIGEPSNLKRSISIYLQVRELGVPCIFVINMKDEIESKGLKINLEKLEVFLETKIYLTNARTSEGLEELIEAFTKPAKIFQSKFEIPQEYRTSVAKIKEQFSVDSNYIAWQYLSQKYIPFLSKERQEKLDFIKKELKVVPKRLQVKETLDRNCVLEKELTEIISYQFNTKETFTDKIDKILIHPILGYIIFLGIMLLIFQAIYSWSAPLMSMVEYLFEWINNNVNNLIPPGPINDIITGAIIPGIEGIAVFVPQIAILFLFISTMEETGYMSRVVYLMDRWLKPLGLSGKSVVPLISGVACAVPAIMSARNIENYKERLLTILITPFMTCSARLPIYVVLISLVIPNKTILGLNYQALMLFLMYLFGVLGALGSSIVLNLIVKSKHKSFLILEMPSYKLPDWKNVIFNVWEKTSGFLINAGKIIFAISIILWVLGSFGFGENFNNAEEIVMAKHKDMNKENLENEIASYKLKHSYLGNLGMIIEPIVEPMGYDWKIGIGLISSFAAREVFVGTMSTVYSLGDIDVDDNTDKDRLLNRMQSEINPKTGKKVYNLATGVSLLFFYAFAMQCMSTIATVKKETNSWKWTLLQAGLMTGFAYLVAFISYNILK